MESEVTLFRRKLGAKWIKTRSGETYLCPEAILDFVDELTEEELRALCVKESVYREIN